MDNIENNNVVSQGQNQTLPNSTTVLVLGILSIIFCSFVGLVLGIVALVLSKKDLALYSANQQLYKKESISNLKAGRTCAIIGVCLSSVALVFMICYIIFVLGLVGVAIFSGF